MKQTVNYNVLEGDSVNGYGVTIQYTFTSFDPQEIEEIKEWCARNIRSGLLYENAIFQRESEK